MKMKIVAVAVLALVGRGSFFAPALHSLADAQM